MSVEKVKHKWFDSIPIIINVGRLIKQKNQNLLLEAFNLVRKSTPARLIMVMVILKKVEKKTLFSD